MMDSLNLNPWSILKVKVDLVDKPNASVYCDEDLQLIIFTYSKDKIRKVSSASVGLNHSDLKHTTDPCLNKYNRTKKIIYLEHIHYNQRGIGGLRSALNYKSKQLNSDNLRDDAKNKQLRIFYSKDSSRSAYLYNSICFELKKSDEEVNQWLNALYMAISEAKKLNSIARRNRWIFREYEKLKRSSRGLTFDSIYEWFSFHIGLVRQKSNIEDFINHDETFQASNEITKPVFYSMYSHFTDVQKKELIALLMLDIIDGKRISLIQFALRVINHNDKLLEYELNKIRKFLELQNDTTEISLEQSINYLWSDENSAFDPVSRTACHQDMNQPLNHYWISSSHNTYLANTQLFEPVSFHCYIQALLKGCRCVEIDVMDNQMGPEPEVTHKNTPIKPIPLRDILTAIYDYGFLASEYPIIISIENHCSSVQRATMATMFVEIFGESLVQSCLSVDESFLPSPNQLKRKIILKDSKLTNDIQISAPSLITDSEDSSDCQSVGLVDGFLELYDPLRKEWIGYNYLFSKNDLYLSKDYEAIKNKSSNEYSDEEKEIERNILSKNYLTQAWFHGTISSQEAKGLLLTNSHYGPGTFLVRRSIKHDCYCIAFLAADLIVKNISIYENIHENGETLYYLSIRRFKSIPDLISFYQTYDFIEVGNNPSEKTLHRLRKYLCRANLTQELQQKIWFQPNVTKQQAEELLLKFEEEMSFLIRGSSSYKQQEYTISFYCNGKIFHVPIYHEGSNLIAMLRSFTCLPELVQFFTYHIIFRDRCLGKPVESYIDFKDENLFYKTRNISKDIMTLRPLSREIIFKINTLRALNQNKNIDGSVEIQLFTYEENKRKFDGYLLRFCKSIDYEIFLAELCADPSGSSSKLTNEMLLVKSLTASPLHDLSKKSSAKWNELIVYCQGVKLKSYNITKPEDLLEKIQTYKEMISLNHIKAASFCLDMPTMIRFNQNHFTRVYPEFSWETWNSYNFDPLLYWSTGCQLVALNFQAPDNPMHYNSGRFAENGGCGYVLMPNYIRSLNSQLTKVNTTVMYIKICVLAVQHLRMNKTRNTRRIFVKSTIISNGKLNENQSCTTTFYGPYTVLKPKYPSSKYDKMLPIYKDLQSNDSDVDLLYFEVITDNEEFCGQSAIPLTSLRSGIRSVHLYDKFNEKLDMSAILIDVDFRKI